MEFKRIKNKIDSMAHTVGTCDTLVLTDAATYGMDDVREF